MKARHLPRELIREDAKRSIMLPDEIEAAAAGGDTSGGRRPTVEPADGKTGLRQRLVSIDRLI